MCLNKTLRSIFEKEHMKELCCQICGGNIFFFIAETPTFWQMFGYVLSGLFIDVICAVPAAFMVLFSFFSTMQMELHWINIFV